MERAKAKAVLEAILFTMGDSVAIDSLAAVIEEDRKTTGEILEEMAQDYSVQDRGIGLTVLDNAVQMCTKGELYEYLIKIAKAPKKFVLTDTLLETLSIIAYKQPVTRLEIERVRGVSCDHAVNKLLEYDLIMEVGRLDAPGRPLLFGTTEQFLRSFGVKSIEDLPELSTVQVDLSSRRNRKFSCSLIYNIGFCNRFAAGQALKCNFAGCSPCRDLTVPVDTCRQSDYNTDV